MLFKLFLAIKSINYSRFNNQSIVNNRHNPNW